MTRSTFCAEICYSIYIYSLSPSLLSSSHSSSVSPSVFPSFSVPFFLSSSPLVRALLISHTLEGLPSLHYSLSPCPLSTFGALRRYVRFCHYQQWRDGAEEEGGRERERWKITVIGCFATSPLVPLFFFLSFFLSLIPFYSLHLWFFPLLDTKTNK